MPTVKSKDGTAIAYERQGSGLADFFCAAPAGVRR
jgi:hypothetical protein